LEHWIASIPAKMTAFALRLFILTTLTLWRASSSEQSPDFCTKEKEWNDHPALCQTWQRLHENENEVVQELHDFARASGWLLDLSSRRKNGMETSRSVGSLPEMHIRDSSQDFAVAATTETATSLRNERHRQLSAQQLPVVLAHGMGDSCFNSGMQYVTKVISQWLGDVYTVCIPTGSTQQEDTKNGYFLNMDASVDVFQSAIALDPALSNGFHAIGFSQGNNVIRGYIAKYNTPTVHTFISVNGVNAGIGAVPYCRPNLQLRFSSMCDLLMEQASNAAYTEFAQQHSFQANYWRDPRPSERETYRAVSQLAVWNNEVPDGVPLNETLRQNWRKTSSFVWVAAEDDQMVWPAEGEQWGAPDPNDPFQHILPMKETEWYVDDLFGLKTADLDGKNHFESFAGDHLQFTDDDLKRWVTTYFTSEAL
jgi:palmitoyl-protein thioesterase